MTANDSENLAEGTLMSHLLELRDRLVRATLAVVLCFMPAAYFQNELFTVVAQPLLEKLPEGTSLIATGIISPFMTPLKLAFYVALFAAMPVVIYQLWAFIAPGLYKKEKRFAMPLLFSAVLLFYVGALFAYFFVFPVMFGYLVGTAPEGVKYMADITSYLDFVITMFFAFGIAFEMPIAVILLVITGVVKVESLANNRGYVLIGIFVVAAFLTPPDAISQSIMAVPMYLLYEGGLAVARVLHKMRKEGEAAEEEEQAEA
jgi:sec-independent protein translocase protein TatC